MVGANRGACGRTNDLLPRCLGNPAHPACICLSATNPVWTRLRGGGAVSVSARWHPARCLSRTLAGTVAPALNALNPGVGRTNTQSSQVVTLNPALCVLDRAPRAATHCRQRDLRAAPRVAGRSAGAAVGAGTGRPSRVGALRRSFTPAASPAVRRSRPGCSRTARDRSRCTPRLSRPWRQEPRPW